MFRALVLHGFSSSAFCDCDVQLLAPNLLFNTNIDTEISDASAMSVSSDDFSSKSFLVFSMLTTLFPLFVTALIFPSQNITSDFYNCLYQDYHILKLIIKFSI
jgi:hypothetical protein